MTMYAVLFSWNTDMTRTMFGWRKRTRFLASAMKRSSPRWYSSPCPSVSGSTRLSSSRRAMSPGTYSLIATG